jgi:hypothetical protein
LKEENKMNYPKTLAQVLTLTLLGLILAGCASAKGLSEMNTWRTGYNTSYLNVRITFEVGDKCVLEQLKPTANNVFVYETVVNNQEHENYEVIIHTLSAGKTLKDLEDYIHKNPENSTPPYFANLEAGQIVNPMSRTFTYAHMPTGEIYFVCVTQGPDNQKVIEALGPVEIKE